MIEPIAPAGWRAPLWLNIEWRFTVLLLFALLLSLMTRIPIVIIVAFVIDLALYIFAFVPLAEREPFILDLWANTRRFAQVLDRLADARSPVPNFPSRQRN
jgi:hypothetical protein